MKVLLIGHEGQLARTLQNAFQEGPNCQLVVVGRPNCDLAVRGSIAHCIASSGPGVVINAAAYTSVDQAEDEPELAFRINAEAPGEAAAAAAKIGAKFIHVSTDYVFDGTGTSAYAEHDPTNPMGIYGRSKLEGENRVRQENAAHFILRTSWVFSPFGKNFLKTMLAVAQQRDELAVVADQFGTPTSAADLARGILKIVDHLQAGEEGAPGTYHVAGPEVVSWHGFAEAIFRRAEAAGLKGALVRPIQTADWPTRAPRPLFSALDSRMFKQKFSWNASRLDAAIDDTLRRLGGSYAESA